MILKLIAFKFRGYIKSRWNIFDGVVVVISLIDTVLTLSNFIDNTGTSVLRSFRLVSILPGNCFSFCFYWSQPPQSISKAQAFFFFFQSDRNRFWKLEIRKNDEVLLSLESCFEERRKKEKELINLQSQFIEVWEE